MLTEMSLKEALKYFMKGRKVLVLNEYDDKSISAKRNKIDTGEEIGRGAGSENRERTEEGIPPEL